MTRIINFFNFKGGVGKTTLAVEIATAISLKNKKTLLIDFDGQSNVSVVWGKNTNEIEYTIADAIGEFEKNKNLDVFDKAINSVSNNLDVIFSDVDMYALENLIASKFFTMKKDYKFTTVNSFLEQVKKEYNYDFIIIDSPPSNSNMQINLFVAADELIIPSKMEQFSGFGIIKVINILKDTEKLLNIPIIPKIKYIIPMYVKNRSIHHKEIQMELKEALKKIPEDKRPILISNVLGIKDSVVVPTTINNRNQPFILSKPNHEISQNIKAITQMIIDSKPIPYESSDI